MYTREICIFIYYTYPYKYCIMYWNNVPCVQNQKDFNVLQHWYLKAPETVINLHLR